MKKLFLVLEEKATDKQVADGGFYSEYEEGQFYEEVDRKEITPSDLERIKSLIIDDLEYCPKGENDEQLEKLLKKLEAFK